MKKYGYKAGIITGLLVFALGSFLFIPAANTQQYSFFLVALFIIACGLTILETAANPLAVALGDPSTGTQRLNFAQAFNGLAAFLASVVGGRIILTKGYSPAQLNAMTESGRKLALGAEASSVKAPYFILGCVLTLVAAAFAFARLPKIQQGETRTTGRDILRALKHRHLANGVVAQFFYVGAQVSVFSLFILYATKSAGITELKATDYLGMCSLAFLIGRFFGTLLMRFFQPGKLLAIYACINIALCIVAIAAHGMITVYTVIGIFFFCSIMFPTIFALSIKDLGGDTEVGSSLVIMAIVGGAIFPRIFGYISDVTGNIQLGYFVPAACLVVVAYFGFKGHKVAKVLPDELPVSTIY